MNLKYISKYVHFQRDRGYLCLISQDIKNDLNFRLVNFFNQFHDNNVLKGEKVDMVLILW